MIMNSEEKSIVNFNIVVLAVCRLLCRYTAFRINMLCPFRGRNEYQEYFLGVKAASAYS